MSVSPEGLSEGVIWPPRSDAPFWSDESHIDSTSIITNPLDTYSVELLEDRPEPALLGDIIRRPTNEILAAVYDPQSPSEAEATPPPYQGRPNLKLIQGGKTDTQPSQRPQVNGSLDSRGPLPLSSRRHLSVVETEADSLLPDHFYEPQKRLPKVILFVGFLSVASYFLVRSALRSHNARS
jgi:hypothetical protein